MKIYYILVFAVISSMSSIRSDEEFKVPLKELKSAEQQVLSLIKQFPDNDNPVQLIKEVAPIMLPAIVKVHEALAEEVD